MPVLQLQEGREDPGMNRKDGRSYITLHDDMMNHPKIEALTDSAKVHLIRLWGYCNKFRTDGIVSAAKAKEKGSGVFKQLTAEPEPMLILQDDGTFYCHDYLKHQWSKAEIEKQSKDKSDSATYGLHVRWHEKRGIHEPECSHCTAA